MGNVCACWAVYVFYDAFPMQDQVLLWDIKAHFYIPAHTSCISLWSTRFSSHIGVSLVSILTEKEP